MTTVHVWIEGRVQGVCFRDATRRRALELALTGWVRNLPDGRVEAVFQGDEEACRQAVLFVENGPPGARVTDVRQRREPESALFERFEITY
jgi:acylphosphatase